MSGLSVTPLLHNPARGESWTDPVELSDDRKGSPNDAVKSSGHPTASAQRPALTSPGWNGDLNHYQSQIVGEELAKSHGRHRASTSPREAARAYGQARRRPQNLALRPRVKAVM